MKWIFPLFWFGMLAFAVASTLLSGIARDQWEFIPMALAMMVFGILLFRKLLWDLADAVDLVPDGLIVRKGGSEERVRFNNIMNVSISQFSNPQRLTLRLRVSGKFGDEVVFIPTTQFRLNPFARNPVAEDLIQRVDHARRVS